MYILRIVRKTSEPVMLVSIFTVVDGVPSTNSSYDDHAPVIERLTTPWLF